MGKKKKGKGNMRKQTVQFLGKLKEEAQWNRCLVFSATRMTAFLSPHQWNLFKGEKEIIMVLRTEENIRDKIHELD